MKKIFIALLVLLSTVCFAKSPKIEYTFDNGNDYITEFWNKGSVIKIVNSTTIDSLSTTYYINKATIASMKFEKDEIEIAVNGYNLNSNPGEDSEDYSADYWILEIDENSNLILRKR